jgi:hypothetical protein
MKDRFDVHLGVTNTLFIGKWTVRVLFLLKELPYRHSQLRRRLSHGMVRPCSCPASDMQRQSGAPDTKGDSTYRTASIDGGEMTLWVLNGAKATSALSPFDSQLRTLIGAAREVAFVP